jgi:DNA N-6-adenine-methyltransferase Dam
VPALEYFDRSRDGLKQSWHGRVWLNPPYDSETGKWLERFVEHRRGIALVFARTETRWFQSVAPRIDAICLIAGRVRFVRGDGGRSAPAPAPSMLLACGVDCADALKRSGLGFVVAPR